MAALALVYTKIPGKGHKVPTPTHCDVSHNLSASTTTTIEQAWAREQIQGTLSLTSGGGTLCHNMNDVPLNPSPDEISEEILRQYPCPLITAGMITEILGLSETSELATMWCRLFFTCKETKPQPYEVDALHCRVMLGNFPH